LKRYGNIGVKGNQPPIEGRQFPAAFARKASEVCIGDLPMPNDSVPTNLAIVQAIQPKMMMGMVSHRGKELNCLADGLISNSHHQTH